MTHNFIGNFRHYPPAVSYELPFITEFLEKLNSAICMTNTDENMFILEQDLLKILSKHFSEKYPDICTVIRPIILIQGERKEAAVVVWAVKPEAIPVFENVVKVSNFSTYGTVSLEHRELIEQQRYKNYKKHPAALIPYDEDYREDEYDEFKREDNWQFFIL